MPKIKITAGDVQMTATLNDSETAKDIYAALPIEGEANRWGDEIYFAISVKAREENAQDQVPSGTIAYWPPGNAFCIFFGQRPSSPVNPLGTLDGDPEEFKKIESGEPVRLEAVE